MEKYFIKIKINCLINKKINVGKTWSKMNTFQDAQFEKNKSVC